MTSGNLSFSEKFKNRKKYLTRTLWTALVALPFVAAYYILGTVLLVSRSINYASIYFQTEEVLKIEKCKATASVLGLRGVGFGLVVLVAIAFAFQGFSYVFNQSQMDFYLSQPTTRHQRLRKNYANAFETFFVMFFVIESVALIIAAAMGAVNGAVLVSTGIEFLRSLVLFFTVYNVTVLAILLCGTLPSALIITLFFAIVSLAISAELQALKEVFFKTFSYKENLNVVLSPLFDRLHTLIVSTTADSGKRFDVASVCGIAQSYLRYEIDILIVGIIAFIFVLIFSRKRKAEMAGKSIAFRPFRWCVKVIASVMVGLGAGLLVYVMNDYVWNDRLYPMMCFIMVLAAVISGCFIEVILDSNIRRFTKGKASTIIAACLVLLTFLIYKGDLLGFDSYIPNASKIESCAILSDYYTGNSWSDNVNLLEDYSENNMYITDIDSFLKMASIGMQAKKNADKNRYYSLGYDINILYRLKDGRKVYRHVIIPYDDSEIFSALASSEEFKKGFYTCFNDETLREEEASGTKAKSITYSSACGTKSLNNFSYAEFSDALRKDILENANFDYLRTHRAVGTIEIYMNGKYYTNLSFPMYDGINNVMAYLKENELYVSNDIPIELVDAVKVTNYYPGIDLDSYSSAEEYPTDVDSTEVMYDSLTNPKEVEEILHSAVATGYNGIWYDDREVDDKYFVEIQKKVNKDDYYGSYGRYYVFEKGKVPEFVVKDTN